MKSLLGIAIHRTEGAFGQVILRVTQHGVPLERYTSVECSRPLFVDAKRTIIVKVSRTQAQGEAETWSRLDGIDRLYFATLLEVGDDYVVQEFVPMDKSGTEEHERQAADLCAKYECDADFRWSQCGVDKRTGTLVIHDYVADEAWKGTWQDKASHAWSTLREAA